jgi:saccharopine dehydrogenase (NAD+, L-lysine forming)
VRVNCGLSYFVPHLPQVTFKFGLGTDFINVLKTIKMLGLDSKEPIMVGTTSTFKPTNSHLCDLCMHSYTPLHPRPAPQTLQVKGAKVTPRDVVAAVLPDPAKIGHLMHGAYQRAVRGETPK